MLFPAPLVGDRVSRFSFHQGDFCCLPRWCLSLLGSNQFPSISQAHCRLPSSLHIYSAFIDISDPIRSHPWGPRCLAASAAHLLCNLDASLSASSRRFSPCICRVLSHPAAFVPWGWALSLFWGKQSRFHFWSYNLLKMLCSLLYTESFDNCRPGRNKRAIPNVSISLGSNPDSHFLAV